jgi:hypothetical protein
MPERTAAIHEVAQAVEHVGDSVDQLIGELRAARDKTHRELAHLTRLGRMVIVGLTILAILSVISAYTLYLANDTISPGGSRFKDNQRRTAAALIRLSVEEDCRFRRAVHGLDAPNPDAPCVAQTPPEVYPGQTVEMPRS